MQFLDLACGTYTFCEVLQTNWTQSFPAAAGEDVVSCAGIESDPSVVLGALGYRETLVVGEPALGNDFGNHSVAPPPPFPVRPGQDPGLLAQQQRSRHYRHRQ